jgi:hypothetical protein
MKIRNLLFITLAGTYFFSGSCGKGGNNVPSNPCSGVTITVSVSKVDALPATANGSITVNSPTGAGFTYSINGGPFGSSNSFNNLAVGSYTITAKNANGCSGSTSVSIIVDPCIGKTIVVSTPTIVGSTPCAAANGSITVLATGGTGFTYNIGGGAFQASPVFNALAPGTYTLGAQDADGCLRTVSATVFPKPAGTLFAAVRTVIQGNCAIPGCHTGPSPQNGINFSDDCTIVNQWDRIKARAVDGIPSFMPPSPNPQLSNADKQKIVDWVNAGHLYTN